MAADESLDFAALERLQLKQWVALSTAAKVDFYEEMIQLAYSSGALRPEGLGLPDPARPPTGNHHDQPGPADRWLHRPPGGLRPADPGGTAPARACGAPGAWRKRWSGSRRGRRGTGSTRAVEDLS